jgi:hypothetical protein
MPLVSTGLSTPGYVTVATTVGLENILDQDVGFVTRWRATASTGRKGRFTAPTSSGLVAGSAPPLHSTAYSASFCARGRACHSRTS